MMTSFLEYGFDIMNQQKEMAQGLKQKAIDEYELALKLPRKKKKAAKKSALLLYSMACYTEDMFKY